MDLTVRTTTDTIVSLSHATIIRLVTRDPDTASIRAVFLDSDLPEVIALFVGSEAAVRAAVAFEKIYTAAADCDPHCDIRDLTNPITDETLTLAGIDIPSPDDPAPTTDPSPA